jgi:chromate transport protein ChrA
VSERSKIDFTAKIVFVAVGCLVVIVATFLVELPFAVRLFVQFVSGAGIIILPILLVKLWRSRK